MCNPRKVEISLSRAVEEAWRETVEEAVSQSEEVCETGRVEVELPLDEEMGDMALEMLEQVLSRGMEDMPAWQRRDDGRLFRELEEVVLYFDPATRRMSVETRLTECITAGAKARAEAAGVTVGEVTAEAMGRYYDDNWGGLTRERAEKRARQDAEHRLEEEVAALRRTQNADALEQARRRARTEAEAEAHARIEEQRENVRTAMRERMVETLEQGQRRAQRIIHRAVGEAYRLTLQRIVDQSGGRTLVDEKTGGVITMELELY